MPAPMPVSFFLAAPRQLQSLALGGMVFLKEGGSFAPQGEVPRLRPSAAALAQRLATLRATGGTANLGSAWHSWNRLRLPLGQLLIGPGQRGRDPWFSGQPMGGAPRNFRNISRKQVWVGGSQSKPAKGTWLVGLKIHLVFLPRKVRAFCKSWAGGMEINFEGFFPSLLKSSSGCTEEQAAVKAG